MPQPESGRPEQASNGQTQTKAADPRKRRGVLIWLGGAIALLLVLILAGMLYESVSEAADVQAYPPPGQMVDVGGYRLHLNCTGTGSPTVIIDAGWGDWSLAWSWVQQAVSKTTQVCTYDRAGMGYSEPGPLPRDAKQIAKELHTLLERGKAAGPFVMVGHSMGGLPVRVFVHDYPEQVKGVVLIESMSPGQATQHSGETTPQSSSQTGGFSPFTLLARIGLVRVLAEPMGVGKELPPAAKRAYVAFSVTPKDMQAWADEGAGMPASFVQADAVKTFGNVPLIVLTSGLNQQTGWQTMQTELLQLSPNSQQIVTNQSGHNIETDAPDAAVAAILKLVSLVR